MARTALCLVGSLAVGTVAATISTLVAFRASREERRRALPGDALVPDPLYVTTQAVTIGAPPSRVWPWLAQMGAGRAGWYSYDRIDNSGCSSAVVLLPECQHVAPGDVFPALPGAHDAFNVVRAQRPQNLILTVPGADDATIVSRPFFIERVYSVLARLSTPLLLAEPAASRHQAPSRSRRAAVAARGSGASIKRQRRLRALAEWRGVA